jgi:uncharacterized protein YijF (DUF1287 family)
MPGTYEPASHHIVSERYAVGNPLRPLIIHNIGSGAMEDDRLFDFKLTGHYRWWAE